MKKRGGRKIPYHIKIKQIPVGMKLGKIIYEAPHRREAHEIKLAQTLIRFGKNVVFRRASGRFYERTPDCIWHQHEWEIKSISRRACSSKNVARILKDAAKQSSRIILDCSQSKRGITQTSRDVVNYLTTYNSRIKTVFVVEQENYCTIDKNDVK